MKTSEIRELGMDEILRKRDELKEALFNLRFQHGIGQLENTARLKQTKLDIARVETILKEKQQTQTLRGETE
jgi:large subunit ribosomal protein L29